MNKNYLEFLKLIFKQNSLLRVLQIYECINIKLYGISLEFGATENKNKTFSNFVKGGSKFHYSNKISNKKLKVFYVLEHLPEYKFAISEIYRITKKKGNLIG